VEREPEATVGLRVAVTGPLTFPVSETVPPWPARLLGWSSAIELPPSAV
jgi:hypothetical protein